MAARKLRVIRTVEEFDAHSPIVGKDLRDCAGCGQPTYLRERGQRTKGRCLDCMHWVPVADDALEALDARALATLQAQFPGVESIPLSWSVRDGRTPRWMLFRAYWLIEHRWDQRWIWVTPNQAAPLLSRKVA